MDITKQKKTIPGGAVISITSVSVGELFGQLLAFQFAEWLEPEAGSQSSEAGIIEAGAHDGTLAGDILSWLQRARPELFERIEYGIIEPSVRRQEWQKEKLEKFAPQVRWFTDFNSLPRVTRHPSPGQSDFLQRTSGRHARASSRLGRRREKMV